VHLSLKDIKFLQQRFKQIQADYTQNKNKKPLKKVIGTFYPGEVGASIATGRKRSSSTMVGSN